MESFLIAKEEDGMRDAEEERREAGHGWGGLRDED